MCEYFKLKIENWNLKSICEMSGRNLKIWKLKCLNFENWNVWILKLKIEMFEYWKLKIEMFKY
jgi:hypothetical protein